jgi:hypothetical protein
MTKIEIFEPALCCATGVCGPEPDAVLVHFGEVMRRVETELVGRVALTRTLLNQQPMRFTQVPVVFDIIKSRGVSALPIVVVNGSIVLEGSYPTFEQIEGWSNNGGRVMGGKRPRQASDEQLRPFCSDNMRAYLAVLVAWIAVSAVNAWIVGTMVTGRLSFLGYFVMALVAVMSGMAIMFVSSLINLRKLRPGFERLARGESDPEIPPVWCPVLTSATQAAMQLAHEVAATQRRNGRK